jgi:hypothetical protein
MPAYKNNTDDVQYFGGVMWVPDETREVDFFVPQERMELISDEPYVHSPLLYDRTATDETVYLPDMGDIEIILYLYSDAGATVRIADDAAAKTIPAGAMYYIAAPWRYIGKVEVTGTVQITVETAKE